VRWGVGRRGEGRNERAAEEQGVGADLRCKGAPRQAQEFRDGVAGLRRLIPVVMQALRRADACMATAHASKETRHTKEAEGKQRSGPSPAGQRHERTPMVR